MVRWQNWLDAFKGMISDVCGFLNLSEINTGSNPVLTTNEIKSMKEKKYIVTIIEEGDNSHLEHTYLIDEKREYAFCPCGRLLYREEESKETL